MRRCLALPALLCIVASAHAERTALILIRSEAALPSVQAKSAPHMLWALWPPAEGDGNNRVLGLVTGMNWQGTPSDAQFRSDGRVYESLAMPTLRTRGHFQARDQWLWRRRI
ncbi:MAG: hypothetical protein HY248_06255, partial [Fimbriimonas ginsengisoli]|nr:hypothetical protein [Fimbriimonas ginsengisoli]